MSSLAGLVANYGDSDDEREDPVRPAAAPVPSMSTPLPAYPLDAAAAAIHPPPIPHCPWSACYDEGSGFTYYWNQQTNAVTWEAPPEYLLALKLAQQHLHTAGSTEVSVEEWQLYQQALAEKQNSQNKQAVKAAILKPTKNHKEKPVEKKPVPKYAKKRSASDDEEEKIELITSYYNSDSESNDEAESPVKSSIPPKPQSQVPKPPAKKLKKQPPLEYGPSLPPNQNYSVPIGPELPPDLVIESKSPKLKVDVEEGKNTPKESENEDSQDENSLLKKLKDKAKLLEKLGGELPSELQKMIKDDPLSGTASPARSEGKKEKVVEPDIDDLLEEIEKKELPKVKSKAKLDMFEDNLSCKSSETSARNSPKSNDRTPPRDEIKPLFPSSKNIVEEEKPILFPSAVNVQENGTEKVKRSDTPPLVEKKTNMYLSDSNEVPTAGRKKLRISNSVLPDRKTETPSYTTKYSSHIEGFSSERTGLGFSKEEDETTSPKNTISYGKGLMFTKGETLNEEKKDEDLDDLMELVEAKLKYLNQLQPCVVTPVQEMLIQMQALASAFRCGALSSGWWRRWVGAAGSALEQHEQRAAPAGWALAFLRSAGRYQYVRESDGLMQWEYPAPAPAHTQPADMDISTTPPHNHTDKDDILVQPPLPVAPPPPLDPPPPPRTPPPPAWHDPPPPGTDDAPPPPLPPEPPKQEIGDELASFYNDLAELEKHTPAPPPPAPDGPAPPPALTSPEPRPAPLHAPEDKKDKEGKVKKKSKVKISSSIGMKHKSVSNLVAKWQQVAEEINSD